MRRKPVLIGTAIALAVLLVAGATFLVHRAMYAPRKITALFPTATAIYPGDEVRVAGVKVGKIDAIDPTGTQTRMTLSVDRDVPIPADAKAIVIAPNLISARYVQLTPSYREGGGPKMADGATIPADRTAVPVEWDEVKTQLTRLATELGPKPGEEGAVSGTSVSRFIDTAANALDGNGEKLRQTLAELSGVGRILANGSGDIVSIIKNLQVFVAALSNSSTQIVQFQNRLATLTSVLDDNSSDLDGALSNLSSAIGDVKRFVAGSRAQTSEQIQRLANVTQVLVDQKQSVENVLHIAPNAFANGYNIYNPEYGDYGGAFALPNFSNPIQFVCGAIGAVENTTAPETAKLCAQYLGPALRLLTANSLIPVPLNPYLGPSANPANIVYTDPALAPNGGGTVRPPEPLPAVSAYVGSGDVPPPPGWGGPPGPSTGQLAPNGLPAPPSPPLLPDAPVVAPWTVQPAPGLAPEVPAPGAPPPATVPGMLLPAEGAPPGPPAPGQPLPAEGTPGS